jgi:hypothetical protein
MEHRTLIAAASLAIVLAGAVAITAPASSAPMSMSPAVAQAAAAQPTGDKSAAATTAWLYRIEADWVRMHTRPSASSTTKALARKWDGSGVVSQRAPQSNGFTLFTDRNNGVTGWVSTGYVEELLCLDGDCE